MERLFQIIDNVRKLDQGKMFVAVFQDRTVKQIVIHLNTDGQLRFGELSDGGVLDDYSSASVNLYGKPSGPIQLFDTGDFYESFQLEDITKDGFTIAADSLKTDAVGNTTDLAVRYTDDILGLTDESIGLLVEDILPFIIDYVKREILR